MIGRSLVIFQLGNNQNELHQTNSWGMALSHSDNNINQKIIEERKKKNWKPEDIVSDAEVEAICNATNCLGPQEPGYHKWASDGVMIINISDDPNLYNPLVPIRERKEATRKKRREAIEQLQQYLPELSKLEKAVPVGTIKVDIVIPVRVEVRFSTSEAISSIDVSNGDERAMWGHQLVDRTELAKVPEIAAIVNCPLRKVYMDRCQELAQLLGLRSEDVRNELYSFSRKK